MSSQLHHGRPRGESNIYIKYGISVYLNASYDKAFYKGTLAATCTGSTAACTAGGTLNVAAPPGLNVRRRRPTLRRKA